MHHGNVVYTAEVHCVFLRFMYSWQAGTQHNKEIMAAAKLNGPEVPLFLQNKPKETVMNNHVMHVTDYFHLRIAEEHKEMFKDALF